MWYYSITKRKRGAEKWQRHIKKNVGERIEEPRAFGIDPKRGKRKMNGGKKWNWNNY